MFYVVIQSNVNILKIEIKYLTIKSFKLCLKS